MNEDKFQQVIKKIPGKLPVESNKEKQGYIGSLISKTKLELLDLLSRQDKLLNNKSFIRKLADKGEKITKFRNEIETEIQKRNESDKLSEILKNLNINGKEGLDNLEWTGKCTPGSLTSNQKHIEDESDDETDPLKIFAGHSGAGYHKKIYKVIKPEDPLVKPSDLTDVDVCSSNSDNSGRVVEDEYAKALRSKLDSKCNQTKGRFLPHRTINPPKNKEVKEKKQSKFWEVTAATPPPPVHGDTKLVSLEESIQLQYNQQKMLKESQLKHAAERLALSSYLTIGGAPHNITQYRDHDQAEPSSSDEESSEGEDESVDEDDHGGGVVVYNIVDL